MKELLDNNYVIVLDTNVLLNVYRYSPEFSDFALECLGVVKDYIYLPATVALEYEKYYRGCFKKMERRVTNAGKDIELNVEQEIKKIIGSCDTLERLQFPNVEDLRDSLSIALDEVKEAVNRYFRDHTTLDLIQCSWGGKDYLKCLVETIEISGHIMPSPTQKDLYIWCEEGEKRYKNKIPPGFKDAKSKDGIKKYSDLILWNEVLRFAKCYRRSGLSVNRW